MKPIVLVLLILVATAVFASAQRTTDAQLDIRLRSDKDSYSLGGEIRLEIIRENAGAHRLIVCRQWGWGIARTEVHVFDTTGKEVHADFMPTSCRRLHSLTISSWCLAATSLERV
jgi:hypothetical protein